MSAPKRCEAWWTNRRLPDFSCKLNGGHGGPHIDPKTGAQWGEPKVPLGLRRRPR